MPTEHPPAAAQWHLLDLLARLRSMIGVSLMSALIFVHKDGAFVEFLHSHSSPIEANDQRTRGWLAAAYVRGGPYMWVPYEPNPANAMYRCQLDFPQGCEQCALAVYPICAANFSPLACTICYPNCPSNLPDGGGLSCTMASYSRIPYRHPHRCLR